MDAIRSQRFAKLGVSAIPPENIKVHKVAPLKQGTYLRFLERPGEMIDFMHENEISFSGMYQEATSTFPRTFVLKDINNEDLGFVLRILRINYHKNNRLHWERNYEPFTDVDP